MAIELSKRRRAVHLWLRRYSAIIGAASAVIGLISGVVGVVGLKITVRAYREAGVQAQAAERAAAELREETARLRLTQEVTLNALQNARAITGVRRDAKGRTVGLDAAPTLTPIGATGATGTVSGAGRPPLHR